jgi:hypothetical protein
MQRLEVSGVVRHIYMLLGIKGLLQYDFSNHLDILEVCSTMSHLHIAGMLDTQPYKNPLYPEIFQPKPYVVMSEPCVVLSWW